jgi:hypothetical protein
MTAPSRISHPHQPPALKPERGDALPRPQHGLLTLRREARSHHARGISCRAVRLQPPPSSPPPAGCNTTATPAACALLRRIAGTPLLHQSSGGGGVDTGGVSPDGEAAAIAGPALYPVRIGYSEIAGGTRLYPHCGQSNAQWKLHLGLLTPSGTVTGGEPRPCARMRVGNETREWQAGVAVLFDDSWEHEVWSHCGTRVVLQLVFRHPALSE